MVNLDLTYGQIGTGARRIFYQFVNHILFRFFVYFPTEFIDLEGEPLDLSEFVIDPLLEASYLLLLDGQLG